MVDFAYPVRWLAGQITDMHHSAKTIERFNFGKVYTIAYDNYFDYYVIQPLVRPVFDKIANHQKTAYSIGACLILGLILIKAHPLRHDINLDPHAVKPPARTEDEEGVDAPEDEEEVHSDHEEEALSSRRKDKAEGSDHEENINGLESAEGEEEVEAAGHEEENNEAQGTKVSADKKSAAPSAAKAAPAISAKKAADEKTDDVAADPKPVAAKVAAANGKPADGILDSV